MKPESNEMMTSFPRSKLAKAEGKNQGNGKTRHRRS